jgi:hypothetical protein
MEQFDDNINGAKYIHKRVERYDKSQVSNARIKSFRKAIDIISSQRDYIYDWCDYRPPIICQDYTHAHSYVQMIMDKNVSKTTLKKYRKKMMDDEKNKIHEKKRK